MRIAATALLTMIPALQAGSSLVLSADGFTVYDTVNNITWLADANLPATYRFGLQVCHATTAAPCINQAGSMTYQAAVAWVAAMNAANYLGHSNWQIPTAPLVDNTCTFIGPQNNSFGWNCVANALGSLYYTALGFSAPNTAVPIPANTVGPFSNFQPYQYWSQTIVSDNGFGAFSFNSGYQGSNTDPNFLYVFPMIRGKIAGTPAATGNGLQVNPGGQTVYDPIANVTWAANANLAATNTFGLATCKAPGTPKLCVDQDGAMNSDTAAQLIANMNSAKYLGQSNWQLPTVDPNCDVTYTCTTAIDPMGILFYTQLGMPPGMPVVAAPNVPVGPFNNIQPYLYWECGGDTLQGGCKYNAAPGFEWSFSFGNGFLGTDVLANDLYVTAYFAGTRTSTPGPVIAQVANAEGESPAIAPNTWLEIKGAQLAPLNDVRIWQASDFNSGQMPTALDKVSVTVNGKSAFVYYISPQQINVLTPPDAMNGPAQVVVTNNGATSAAFTVQAQAISPSFFVFAGGPYVAAEHVEGTLVGPSTLYPGSSTPAKPGETIVLYGNGFGATSVPLVSGSSTQSGTLSTLPVIKIGGVTAMVQFAGLIAPGEFQFNVTIPASLANGDQPISATYGGLSTQAGTLVTVHN